MSSPTSTAEEYVLYVVEVERQVGEWVVDIGYAGEVVTKEQLMKFVWPDSFVEEGNLNRNVSTLRKALDEKPKQSKLLLVPAGELAVEDLKLPLTEQGQAGSYLVAAPLGSLRAEPKRKPLLLSTAGIVRGGDGSMLVR